jgi:hypothetical protein
MRLDSGAVSRTTLGTPNSRFIDNGIDNGAVNEPFGPTGPR